MPRAGKRAWLIAGAVVGLSALELGWVVTAPDVAATCTHVLALAEQAGETTVAGDREACEQRYGSLRERLGLRGWAKLARCVARARTIPDAGGC